MGIFSNDRSGQPTQGTDDLMMDNNPAQQTYIDGVMAPHPGGDDAAMQQSVNDLVAQSSSQSNPPSGANYSIMKNPPVPAQHQSEAVDPEDLVSIRQQALQQLSPLVAHLDQTPEEKFHTTMMMLQATDDHTLVKVAFEAAQAIEDDRARAQALLDVINEINYFTSQQRQQQ